MVSSSAAPMPSLAGACPPLLRKKPSTSPTVVPPVVGRCGTAAPTTTTTTASGTTAAAATAATTSVTTGPREPGSANAKEGRLCSEDGSDPYPMPEPQMSPQQTPSDSAGSSWYGLHTAEEGSHIFHALDERGGSSIIGHLPSSGDALRGDVGVEPVDPRYSPIECYPPAGSLYDLMTSMYGSGSIAGSAYGGGGLGSSMYDCLGNMEMGGSFGGMEFHSGICMGRSMQYLPSGGVSTYALVPGLSLGRVVGDDLRNIGGMWGGEPQHGVHHAGTVRESTMLKMLREDEPQAGHRRFVRATARQLEKEAQSAPSLESPVAEGDSGTAVEGSNGKQEDEAALSAAPTSMPEDASQDEQADSPPSGTTLRAATPTNHHVGNDILTDGNKIFGAVIIEDDTAGRISWESTEKGQKVVLTNAAGETVEAEAVSEVMEGAHLDFRTSSVFHLLAAHLRRGHNIALLALDTNERMSSAIHNGVCSFFVDTLRTLRAGTEWWATFTASALTGNNKCRDLLDAGSSTASVEDVARRDMKFGSNPMFGGCVMGLKTCTVWDTEAVAREVENALSASTGLQELLFLQAILIIRKGADVCVCSMNAFVARDSGVAEAIASLDEQRVPAVLLRPVMGGATRTAVLTVLTGLTALEAEEAAVIRIMHAVCKRESLPPRSGNVARFIRYTNAQILRVEKEAMSRGKSDGERRVQTAKKLRIMTTDAGRLIEDKEAEPMVYAIHNRSGAATAAEKNGKHPKEAPAASVDHQSRTLNAASASLAPTEDARDSLKPTEHASGTASPLSTTPFRSIHRLALLGDATKSVISKVVQVVLKEGTRTFGINECIERPTIDGTEPIFSSEELIRLGGLLGAGYNVALLGAELTAPGAPEAHVTWRCVAHVLASALQSVTSEKEVQVTVHMSVVYEGRERADLIADNNTVQPLVVAASPIFGPMPHPSVGARARTPEEVKAVLTQALAKATPAWREGSVIVMTAVVRQICQDDVVLASFFAASAADLRLYGGTEHGDPVHPSALFAHALGGPSSTEILLSASRNMDGGALAEALNQQRRLSQIVVPVAGYGSVKDFVRCTQDALTRKTETADTASTADHDAEEMSLRRLEKTLRDHESLLANPDSVDVIAYPPDAATASRALVHLETSISVSPNTMVDSVSLPKAEAQRQSPMEAAAAPAAQKLSSFTTTATPTMLSPASRQDSAEQKGRNSPKYAEHALPATAS